MKKQIKKDTKISELEEKIIAIFDSVRDGIVILNKTGKIIQINKSLIEIGGYSEEELIGKRIKFLTMFTPESLLQILSHFAKSVMGYESSPYEVEAKSKDGKRLFGEISGSPLRIKGKIIGTVAIIRDITERKKTEEELRQKNEELEKVNKILTNRELKMIELKNKIKELEGKLKKGQP